VCESLPLLNGFVTFMTSIPSSIGALTLVVEFLGNESEASFPGKNDIDLTFDGRQKEDTELTVPSAWRLHD
jgi:hypothetical protein